MKQIFESNLLQRYKVSAGLTALPNTILYRCCLVIIILFQIERGYSQKSHTEICVDFRLNSTFIDSAYADNATRMHDMIEFLQNIRKDSTINIIEVSFCGAASPEGSYQINRKLAQGRLKALEKFIRKEVSIPDSLITHNESYIPWSYLKTQIENSDLVYKNEVLAILEEEALLVDYHHPNTHIDNRIVKLQALDNGKVWQEVNKLYFERMRNACAVFVTYKRELPPIHEPEVTPDTVTIIPEPIAEIIPDTVITTIVEVEEPARNLYLKSNAIGWGMLIANAAIEVDLANHWSFSLPVYYSAMNYYTSKLKFRTLCFQPEVRYWFSPDNQGWFGGAHLGLAWFNYAKGGDWRYQDHNRKTPMLGGGLNGGFRKYISTNKRWQLEFSLGCGAYKLHYDIFYNEPNGQLADTRKRTFFGIDHAAISIVYRLGKIKKGDKK